MDLRFVPVLGLLSSLLAARRFPPPEGGVPGRGLKFWLRFRGRVFIAGPVKRKGGKWGSG
jgi:hypothetical protein